MKNMKKFFEHVSELEFVSFLIICGSMSLIPGTNLGACMLGWGLGILISKFIEYKLKHKNK